jgi:ParB-like chromosome segregation protein Spo0J
MAEVPYGGVAQVTPETGVPNDYQNINANPEAFGAGIARGAENLGAGAVKAADFYKQAVNDSVYNDTAQKLDHVLYGDPNKMITGPDGSQQPDTGFLGKHGRDAMDARPQVEQQMNDIIQDAKNNLPTLQMQDQFDSQIRRLQSRHAELIGSHTDQQSNVWYANTNKSSADLALQNIARDANDPEQFAHHTADLQNALINQVRLEGGGAAQMQEAIQRGAQQATEARIHAISADDPFRAQQMVEKNKDTLGDSYATLKLQIDDRANKAYGKQASNKDFADGFQKMPISNPGNPLFTQVASANPGGMTGKGLWTTSQIESGGNPNSVNGKFGGIVNFSDEAFKQYGPPGGNKMNPQDNLMATQNMIKSNLPRLEMAMGRPPSEAESYMIIQQGGGGAPALFQNPNALAVDIRGHDAIIKNVPDNLKAQAETWTCSQFTNYWTNRFNQIMKGMPAGQDQQQQPQQATAQQAGIPTLGQTQVSGAPSLTPPSAGPSAKSANQGLEFIRANAMQSTIDDLNAGRITQGQADARFAANEENYRVRKVAEDSKDEAEKKLQNKTASDIYNKMFDPTQNANIIHEIRTNPGLGDNWKLRQELEHTATHPPSGDETEASPNYMKYLPEVLNHHIDTVQELLEMQNRGELKERDVKELAGAIGVAKDNPQELELQKTKLDALKSIQTQVAYFGLEKRPVASQEGLEFYRKNVINSFETQFKQFRQTPEGQKDPYKFFDQKNLDKFMQGAPGMGDLAVAALNDKPGQGVQNTGQGTPQIQQQTNNKIQKPEQLNDLSVTDYGWQKLMDEKPNSKDKPIPLNRWAGVVSELLLTQNDPQSIKEFDSTFSGSGITAKDVIDQSKKTQEQVKKEETANRWYDRGPF